MAKDKLTDKQIKNAKAPDKLSDGGGLYLVVPTTGSKWWRFDYRFEGKQMTISLGIYGTEAEGGVTLAMARDKATEARTLVKQRKRPIGSSGQTSAEVPATVPGGGGGASRPFAVVADEWLKTRRPDGSEHLPEGEARAQFKTYARDARMIGYLVNGKGTAAGFAGMAFNEIDDILPLLKACNHPTRIRLLSTARKLLAYGRVHRDWPKGTPSPFEGIDFSEGFAKHKEKHRPAIIEAGPFGQLLRKMRAYEGRVDNLTGSALELLALTFVRPGTVASARWEHFDLDKAIWTIPFAELKMAHLREESDQPRDDFIVPLSRQALAVLRELHKITGHDKYLFGGRAGRPMSENTINYALHGLGYKGVHCAHGFRASASTLLNKEKDKDGRRKFERELIEIQLDHLDASIRPIYNRDPMIPERIELMQHWADKIDTMRTAPAGNVVPMKRSA